MAEDKVELRETESPADPGEAKSARDLLMNIDKTSKASKIYLPNNPIIQKFLADLSRKFQEHLEAYDALALGVKQYQLLLGTQAVYANEDKQESLAFKLYRDGIRHISFYRGLEEREIQDFLEVININFDLDSMDDDIVTLLWEKSLENVRYQVVETLEEEASPGDAARLDSQRKREAQHLEKIINSSAGGKTASETRQTDPWAQDQIKAQEFPKLGVSTATIFALQEEEIANIKKQIAQGDHTKMLSDFIQIIYEVFDREQEEDELLEVANTLEKILDSLLTVGNFNAAQTLLTQLRELPRVYPHLSPAKMMLLEGLIERQGAPAKVAQLGKVLNQETAADPRDIYNFLIRLNKSAVPPLAELLGELRQLKNRKILCDALTHICQDEVELLGRKIGDKRWYVVRNIVFILGNTGNPKALEFFKKSLRHAEPRVRKETLRSLYKFTDKGVRELLEEALQDVDMQVRMQAVRALSDRSEQKSSPKILQLVKNEDFIERDFEEKKEFFLALARLTDENVMAVLKENLWRRNWLKKTKIEEMRQGAAFALNINGSPEALALLEEAAVSDNKSVREAAQAALRGRGRAS